MKQFLSKDIQVFLEAVDQGLGKPYTVEIIGGAAAALAFRSHSGTQDIDTLTTLVPIAKAIQAAHATTGLSLPMERTSVSEVPYHYARRLQRVRLPGLKNLRILVPEKHDWALMKIARLLGKDIEDIKEVHASICFSRRVFMRRFLGEMTHVGTPRDLAFSFLAMMQELFGTEEAARMRKAIRNHKHWKAMLGP